MHIAKLFVRRLRLGHNLEWLWLGIDLEWPRLGEVVGQRVSREILQFFAGYLLDMTKAVLFSVTCLPSRKACLPNPVN